MSTLRVNTIQDSTGSSSPAINGLARAWVNFNGTGTVAIRASLNVSSITDRGTGDYLVNFTNSLTDANYSVQLSSDIGGGNGGFNGLGTTVSPSATAFQFVAYTQAGALRDVSYALVSVFR